MGKLLTITFLLLLWACQSESQKPIHSAELKTPSGESIKTTVVYTPEAMEQGLSGVQNEDFKENQGMLFFYLENSEKHFWMPDTYFDLDLFYLDENLKILDIIRKLPHYTGRTNPELIPRARPVFARHVLEMKSTSPIAASLKIGDILIWEGPHDLEYANKEIKKELSRK